jgi:hypothetical protein
MSFEQDLVPLLMPLLVLALVVDGDASAEGGGFYFSHSNSQASISAISSHELGYTVISSGLG